MGQRFVIADIGAHVALVLSFKPAEGALVPRISRAEHRHLGIPVNDLREDGVHQVQALLVSQPGNQPDHHFPVILRKPQLFLQGPFVFLFLLHGVIRVVGRGQQRVLFRIPLLHVDAVHDAAQPWAVIAQMGVQSLAEGGCLDFLGVGFAHRSNPVREGQAALEHVGLILVVLQHRIIKQIIPQAGPVFQVFNAADSLEPEVVDRQDRLCLAHRRIPELRPLVQRNQAALPVVAVNHVRRPVQVIQDGQGSLGKEAVLGNILPQSRIGITPVKELPVVDEVIDDPVHLHFHDADVEISAVRRLVHHKGALVFQFLLIFRGNAGIQGKDDAYLAVSRHQRPGQRVHHVPQTACLYKRIAFGSDKGYFPFRGHGLSPPVLLILT